MSYLQTFFSQMTWILSGIGVPVVIGLVLIIRKWHNKPKHAGNYLALESIVSISILSKDGSLGRYDKTVEGKSLVDGLVDIYDFVAVSGTCKLVDLKGIDAKSSDRFLGAAHRNYFQLHRPVNKHQIFNYKMTYDLEGVFQEQIEYWESEQLVNASIFVFRIIFPTDRLYRSFRGIKRNSIQGEQISVDQPAEKNIDGNPCLEWQICDARQRELYRIEWSW